MMTCNGMAMSKIIGWGMSKIIGWGMILKMIRDKYVACKTRV
jgi:hypothetical protein